jgi:clan AA aspartic protease (TIGR02281 family)
MNGFLLTWIILLLMLSSAHGELYKWVDRHGKVHFTDNLDSIPPEYRYQVEEKATTTPVPPSQTEGKAASPPQGSRGRQSVTPAPGLTSPIPTSHVVPLRRSGNAMFVDAVVNGAVATRFMVDTGASFTVISTAAARRLALNLDTAAVLPMQSASGVFLAPLTKVKSITVGNATVHDVEVIVHDAMPGLGGLLGMSFLDNFSVTISARDESMTLTALGNVPGVETYGGHPKDWWTRKFRFYRRLVDDLKAQLTQQPSSQIEKTLRYFQIELDTLERKASHAAVPRSWRY